MQDLAPELMDGTLDLLREVSTATITSQLIKLRGMRTRAVRDVRPINPARCRFVGPAVTVRYAPFREDLGELASIAHPANPMTAAIESAPAGSVIVIDMGGNTGGGALGDVLIARLVARSIAGVVADGAMRDSGPVAEMALPVLCRAVVASPSFAALLAVETGGVIGCGGVLVYPGDIVAADADGAVVIPRDLADQVARDGLEQERMEAWVRRRIEAGAPVRGLYPPGEEARAEYRAWVAAGRPAV